MTIVFYGLWILAGWLAWYGVVRYLKHSQRKHTEAIRESIRKKAELVEQFAKDQELNKKEK